MDYIHRAMPWNAPKTLSSDDVYALVAYILSLGNIVPDDFTLTDANIADIQALMPSRNGMTDAHGLWTVHGKPDVKSAACMKDCPAGAKTSELPVSAKGVNGNPADQMRLVGESVGVNLAATTPVTKPSTRVDGMALLNASGCIACHGVTGNLVGPSMAAVHDKYQGGPDAKAYLVGKIKSGGSGVWGSIPMLPQPQVSDADVESIAQWILRNT